MPPPSAGRRWSRGCIPGRSGAILPAEGEGGLSSTGAQKGGALCRCRGRRDRTCDGHEDAKQGGAAGDAEEIVRDDCCDGHHQRLHLHQPQSLKSAAQGGRPGAVWLT